MSLPKEPRQKMINMMYLVLTALLALNVSSEILNAFKTVDNSITKSNSIITGKNTVIYKSFEDKLKDPQTAANAAIWKPKADKVKELTNDAFTFIESYKKAVKTAADLKIDSKGVETYKEDDMDASTRIFIEEEDGKKGKALYDKLQSYKKQVLDVLNPAEFADNPAMQAQIKKDREAFEKSLPVDMSIPVSQSGGASTGIVEKDWNNNYFHMTPAVAVITLLSKFQSDVKNSEAQMIDYCHSKIGEVKIVYDKFQAIATVNRSYAMPGEEIEVTAGVGAFSAAAKPNIYVGGQLQSLTPEGTAVFKTTANGAGEHSIDVKIEYFKPDGTKETVPRTVKYTVGVPSGASVFLEKMNVLYIGVDNPMTISAGSAGREKMNVSISTGTLSSAGGDRYIARPTAQGPAKINISVNGKTTSFDMRVKRLPDPTALVGGSKGGPISAALFKAQGGLLAKLMDSDFEAQFNVVSYTVGANGGSISPYREVANDGPRWGSSADALIKQAGPGSSVFFDKIRVKGPDGVVRELPGIFFNLK
jgi:gliding motility-associated protein GldM